MTIRLARHDEIVERMARALHNQQEKERQEDGYANFCAWDDLHETAKEYWIIWATAALAALLTAVRELGVGRDAFGWRMAADEWHAETEEQQHEFPALILQLEDKP